MTGDFASTLRRLRKASGMTQRAVAEKAGLDRTFLSHLEGGRRSPPDRQSVLGIARAMKLTPGQTDELLQAAGHAPETALDVLDVDLRDERLRSLLHALANLLPSVTALSAPPPPAEAVSLTAEEEKLDDLLTLILTGQAGAASLSPLEGALSAGGLPWELRRRTAEALPSLARLDIRAALRMAEILRSDYDPDKWHADVRRRVVEAVPALYAQDAAALGLLDPREEDQVYVSIAAVEVMHDIGEIPRQEAGRIRAALGERERPEHAGVVEFLSGLLDLIAKGQGSQALGLMRSAQKRERVFRICIARCLRRLFSTQPQEALWFMLYFLRRSEGRPAEHANVRRPMAIALPDLIVLLDTDAGVLSRVVIRCLGQDEDILIRRAVVDDLARLAERDVSLAREIVNDHFLVDSDPYIRRRAWKALVELGLGSEGQGV